MRSLVEMEGSGTVATVDSLGANRRVEPDIARGTAELLQESAESRGLRCERQKLGGEPCWKTNSNRTEDVVCWF